MSIVGIGADVVHLPRITALIARRGSSRLARRILSREEHDDWQTCATRDIDKFLAVRFSVKEAAYKALYPIARPTWQDLTYRGFGQLSPQSKPLLVYKPIKDLDAMMTWKLFVSVSHDVICLAVYGVALFIHNFRLIERPSHHLKD